MQKLLPRDHNQRLKYSNVILNLAREIDNFSEKMIMSDEAHFHLSGHVNKQNSRFWGSKSPQIIHETSLHPQKITVWCAIMPKMSLDLIFLKTKMDKQQLLLVIIIDK